MKIEPAKLQNNKANASFASLMGGDKGGVTQISIEQLMPYPNQPFQVNHDEGLQELAEDIKANGILFPVIVRPMGSQYQILAGHRRTAGAKLAGLLQVPCIIKDVDNATAKLIVTNTNLTQRQKLLPSERAFAYLMQKEAYEELGAHRVRTTTQIAEDNSESVRMIQYYLRLTQLIKPLLDLVDNETVGVKTGAVLSNLSVDEQNILAGYLYELIANNIKFDTKRFLDIPICRPVTKEKLQNLFFPTKSKEELPYCSYIINGKELGNMASQFQNLKRAVVSGVVLEKKDYAKFLAAKKAIDKQLLVLEGLLKEKV